MRKIDLTDSQRRVLDGYACHKCKVDSILVDPSEVKGMEDVIKKKVWVCPRCLSYTPAYPEGHEREGQPSGRLMTVQERMVRNMVAKEVKVIVSLMSTGEQEMFMEDVRNITGIPEEYLELSRMSIMSMYRVLACLAATPKGAKILTVFDVDNNTTLRCAIHKNFLIGSSPCRGCPDCIINMRGKVACARNMSYGVLKDRDMEEKYGSSIDTVLNK